MDLYDTQLHSHPLHNDVEIQLWNNGVEIAAVWHSQYSRGKWENILDGKYITRSLDSLGPESKALH